MKEQFVTYEIALKLKELGFDEDCFGTWWFRPDMHRKENEELIFKLTKYFELPEYEILAPTWQQAIDWLREKYVGNIIIMLCIIPSNEIKYYIFKGKLKWDWNELYNTYEEAREQAILKAIELINKK